MLKKVRRIVEYTSLSILILIPFLSYLNTLREAYGINGFHMAELSGGWLVGRLYAMYEYTLGRLEDPVSLIDSIKGTFWSVSIFGLRISDPLAGIGYILSARFFYIPLLVSLIIPLVFTLVFGRAYCGWICPVNTIAEWNDRLRDRLQSHLGWIMDIEIGHGTKYWVFLFTIILIAITGIPLFAYYLPYLILGREVYNLVYFHTVSLGIILIILLILFELFISRRGWCRYLCPSGALLSIIGSGSLIKVKRYIHSCPETCFECDRVCPMGLKVREGVLGGGCTNCGDCVIACPQNGLGYSLNPWRGLAYATIVVVILLVFSIPVQAHHIAGLPHYGYTENYPQVPTNEQKKEGGRFVLSLTTIFFQGIEQKLSNIPYDTQFYLHIYDKNRIYSTHTVGFQNPFDPDTRKKRDTQQGKVASYEGEVILSIFDKQDRGIGSYALNKPSEESIYRFRHYFKRPGDYTVRVTFFPDGRKEMVTFPVKIAVAGNGRTEAMVEIGVGGLLAILLFLYIRGRKRRITLAG